MPLFFIDRHALKIGKKEGAMRVVAEEQTRDIIDIFMIMQKRRPET